MKPITGNTNEDKYLSRYIRKRKKPKRVEYLIRRKVTKKIQGKVEG